MIVSIYENVSKTEGSTVNLFDVLTTAKWKHLSDKVRAEKEKAKRDKLKQQLLPAFTPSGVFKENERKDEGLLKHSGMMCIDIDGDDNPDINDWENVMFQLGKLPEVAFAGLSVSGNGVFAMIPITHPNRHKEHFKAFQKSFEKRGLVIDPKCGNVSRLRFYSYNNKYHINKHAKRYTPMYQKPPPSITTTHYHSNESDVEALVREIETRGVVIAPNYDTWFNVGAALSNVYNGRALFHRISRIDASKYDHRKCDKQFDSFKPSKGITINSLFHIAKQYGITIKMSDRNNNLFANWINVEKAHKQRKQLLQQKRVEAKQQERKLACYVDNDGRVYVPNPCGGDTFAVHKSVEQYNSHKGLPLIVDKGEVDTSQMGVQHINLSTLLIT